ncbi:MULTISPECIES: PD-(D/E)XK nuclease family protein [Pseudoalteromonas]|uniref:PD-(D/E)XK nuclease family protein n=1 Tax=Pseudoalteromonas TaxID=53246 RepID=UPI0022B1C002|nr:PD-(D/E)XK nuclease family protein [Pseudoalteromonas shioyasakiensis]MCZ4251213.1 PD-(D/E)XK nuclease family protein [Pseudoalteromonas shioyasakiensis]|tara:strand:+ start:2246 stop:3544 length:1299 start_codon:yes stop_codon:yes gene_type:complete
MTDLLHKLNHLITDKDFQLLTRLCISTSLFEYIHFDENRRSDTLAWLLAPNEGHQQGEYFIKALVNAVYSKENEVASMPPLDYMLRISFSGIQVLRELAIDVNDGKKRIDLLLVDPLLKLVIVIERKDGSYAKNNQLLNYADWVERNYEGWQHIFVLSDSYGLNHSEQYDQRYIQIDDTWICNALLDVIERKNLTPRLENQFRDIHDFIFGEWEESRDNYYRNFDKTLKSIAHTHSDTLRLLVAYSIEVNDKSFNLLETSQNMFYSDVLPNLKSEDSDFYKIATLVHRYFNVFDHLHGLTEFDQFEEGLLSLNYQLETEVHSDHIYFTLKKFIADESYWPISFQLHRTKLEPNNEDSTEVYEFNAFFSKYSEDKYHGLADRAATAFKKPFKTNQKKASIKRLAVFDQLDMSPNSDLVLFIEKQLSRINELSF